MRFLMCLLSLVVTIALASTSGETDFDELKEACRQSALSPQSQGVERLSYSFEVHRPNVGAIAVASVSWRAHEGAAYALKADEITLGPVRFDAPTLAEHEHFIDHVHRLATGDTWKLYYEEAYTCNPSEGGGWVLTSREGTFREVRFNESGLPTSYVRWEEGELDTEVVWTWDESPGLSGVWELSRWARIRWREGAGLGTARRMSLDFEYDTVDGYRLITSFRHEERYPADDDVGDLVVDIDVQYSQVEP